MGEQNKQTVREIAGMVNEMSDLEREMLLTYVNAVATGKRLAYQEMQKAEQQTVTEETEVE